MRSGVCIIFFQSNLMEKSNIPAIICLIAICNCRMYVLFFSLYNVHLIQKIELQICTFKLRRNAYIGLFLTRTLISWQLFSNKDVLFCSVYLSIITICSVCTIWSTYSWLIHMWHIRDCICISSCILVHYPNWCFASFHMIMGFIERFLEHFNI